MALTYGDRVQETFTTTGTGTISLGGAVTGYQAFSAIVANAGTCYYTATDGTNWEVGLGTYATSGDTLARTTILASSNSGSAVSWASGTKNVWLDFPAYELTQATGTGALVRANGPSFSGQILAGGAASNLGSNAGIIAQNVNGGAPGIAVGNAVGASATSAILFLNSNGTVGSVTTNASATSFNTSSDYRLKTVVTPTTDPTALIEALQIHDYKWNSDQSAAYGCLAHELAAVLPSAVTGEKDAVDENGKVISQLVDYSKLIPYLAGALQQALARIAVLEQA